MTDKALIQAIREGGTQRKKALKALYLDQNLEQSFQNLVMSKGGNRSDAEDVFHEAIIRLDEKIRMSGLEVEVSVRSYLQGIGRYIWIDHIRKNKRNVFPGQASKMDAPIFETPETYFLEEEKKILVRRVLSQLSDSCREILKLYMQSHSMKAIARMLNLPKEDNAKKRAYRCRIRFRELLAKHPGLKEYFI